MKILQVNKLYYPWIGGIEKIVQQLAEGFNDNKNQSVVLCCQPKGQRAEENINGVRVIRAGSFGMFLKMPISLGFFKEFKKMATDCDVIDLHHPFPLNFLAYLIFKPKAKLIVHYHADIIKQKISGFLIKPLIMFVLKKADKIVVSNPNIIASSSLLRGVREKCMVIPFGVDLAEIEQNIDNSSVLEIKKQYGDFVLFVGRLSYYKGVKYLIEAIKNVKVNLVIIGEGKEKDDLKAQVKELKIEDRVFFLPTQERRQLINFYKAAKVFALPSIYKSEAFGIVLLEAMACGTPVISTELGTGTSFVNLHEVSGLVVPPKDSMALSVAISKLIDNEQLRGDLGQQARQLVEEKFLLDSMLLSHQELYA